MASDYIGPDSMTRWIIEKSQGFTNVGLLRISESVRAYAYLILSSQASARSNIVGNTASALTARKAFLNNFEDIINRRVNIGEDIKQYQDMLSYASVPDQVVTLAQDGTSPNMGWPNKELTTLSLLRPKIPQLGWARY